MVARRAIYSAGRFQIWYVAPLPNKEVSLANHRPPRAPNETFSTRFLFVFRLYQDVPPTQIHNFSSITILILYHGFRFASLLTQIAVSMHIFMKLSIPSSDRVFLIRKFFDQIIEQCFNGEWIIASRPIFDTNFSLDWRFTTDWITFYWTFLWEINLITNFLRINLINY